MKQRISLIRLLPIFLTLLIGTALHSPVTAQTSFADDFRPTAAVETGPTRSVDDICEARLLKVLDALEKAESLIGFKDKEIEARKRVEAVANELLAIKDLIIIEQDRLIKLLQSQKKGNSIMDRLKSLLRIAEKVAIVAAGILIGRGL